MSLENGAIAEVRPASAGERIQRSANTFKQFLAPGEWTKVTLDGFLIARIQDGSLCYRPVSPAEAEPQPE